ncbi:uncharacterized protein DUF4251 [Flavobacteriaceae bacterium MAR_2010_105]|nr:uncharacterized protein DUF4251 [Flavobacteriaceae bacterium MAR_2010_105]
MSLVVLVLIVGCASSNTHKYPENLKAYQDLQQLVNSQRFTIDSRRALPAATLGLTRLQNANFLGAGNSAGNIDITGNYNYLRVEGDSVFAFLPFYGEQRTGSNYANDTRLGIEFKGIPNNYMVIFDDEKLKAQISFSIKDQYRNHESYNVYINLFTGLKCDVRVLSTTRSGVAYIGTVEALKAE